jgi:hypothetical protein
VGADQEECLSLFGNPEKRRLFLALEWLFLGKVALIKLFKDREETHGFLIIFLNQF